MKLTDAVKDRFLDLAGWIENASDVVFERHKISKFSVGDITIVPRFFDDRGSVVETLDTQGFLKPKTIDVDIGNQTAQSMVYMPDPNFTGDRWIAIRALMQDPEEKCTILFIS